MAVPSILHDILQTKSREVIAGKANISTAGLTAQLRDCTPTRGFEKQLRAKLATGPAIIAEVKKASPSAGVIREDFYPDQIAQSYEKAGAACLSVLTDRDYFQGKDEYLQLARNACNLPVLRKDFMIDPWQILQSRVLGADCILLIAAALEPSHMADLLAVSKEVGLDALIEVHNEEEMEQALQLDHQLIGVNNRNLNTFETMLATSERLKKMLPAEQILVTESGIKSVQDVQRMQAAGINAFLVGEAFMCEPDPGEALRRMFF